jgi:hypothetical protein
MAIFGHFASDLILVLRFSSDLCWTNFTQGTSAFRFCPAPGHSLLWRIVPDSLLRPILPARFAVGFAAIGLWTGLLF